MFGHVKLDQTSVQAAINLCNRQVGLNIKSNDLTLVSCTRMQDPDERCFNTVYYLNFKHSVPLINITSKEIQDLNWLSPSEIKVLINQKNNMAFTPTFLVAIKELHNCLIKENKSLNSFNNF